jgi:L-fuconolactonase
VETIDAHHHFWRRGESHQDWRGPEHEALDRDFQPDDLAEGMRAAGVERTVLVQSVNTAEENDRLYGYARTVGFVAGVVAWLPLDAPDTAGSILDTLTGRAEVRGVRCLVGRDDVDWLGRPGTVALLTDLAAADLTWDVVPVTAAQVRAVRAVLDRVPGLRVVVDHLGRPPVETDGWQPWAAQLAELAAAPGVAVKVSVGIDALTAWPRWDADRLQRYVDHAAATFGPDRIMLASNWPVVQLRQDYPTAWTDLDRCLQRAGVSDLAAVRGGTARRWYRLGEGSQA